MVTMNAHPPRSVLALLLAASVLSCSENPNRPRSAAPPGPRPQADGVGVMTRVIISQVYGGGGNSGATLKNDFVELFNPNDAAVALDGWSVQYASTNGSSWQVTPLTGSIPAHGYYLVQEAKGSGGTVDLPTPDAVGTIMMGATGGKVLLAPDGVARSGVCPGGPIADQVSFGSATNCGFRSTKAPANATAAVRKAGGCTYTGDLSADFVVTAPVPHNSGGGTTSCAAAGPLARIFVGPVADTVVVGNAIQLVAIPLDASGQTLWAAELGWSSGNAGLATVDASGLVAGVAADPNPVTMTATVTGSALSATAQVTVNNREIHWIDVSSSATSFPPGFQTQLFLTAREASGGAQIPAIFTVLALDPATAVVATVNGATIVTGISAPGDTVNRPGFLITATPIGGGVPDTFTTHAIAIEPPHAADPSIYARNDEFGDPTPADTANPTDMLIVRPQYTLSYNQSRGTPNWVSYELDSRQVVAGQDRCNCFTADPRLPPAHQIYTSDYTNGGYDRGHMTKSADRTAGNVDNASTFYLTNIVPQQSDLNSGPWGAFENALSDSAQAGRAVYIVAGPLYTGPLTFLKNEGKVAVPDRTWKVALIGPRTNGAPFTRASLQSWADLDVTVLAVDMPNVAGVRNDPWTTYLTTVDAIETATGYDILSLLPAPFQAPLEAGDHRPVAHFSVAGQLEEGAAVTFDGSASTDPDLGQTILGTPESLSYSWLFSDGSSASGAVVEHRFADNGGYSARLTVTDAFGWSHSAKTSVTIANVPPTVTFAAPALSVVSGDSVWAGFTDPGPDAPWTGAWAWSNGASASSTAGAVGAMSASTAFLAPGSYTLTLAVTDKDGGKGVASASVTIDGRAVPGVALPSSIDAAETDGDILVTLSSAPAADVTTLDPGSVAVGSVGLSKKVKVKDQVKGGGTITLRFARQALVDAGLLTPATTELVITGVLASGVQIVSHVPVNVH